MLFVVHKFILMKKLIFLVTLLFGLIGSSQILEPVKWEFESKKLSDNTYELSFIANIETHWAVYSQFLDEGGPIPTTFVFDENDDYKRVDEVLESDENKVTKHDPVFDMQVSKFYDRAVFKQIIAINNPETLVSGSLTFMTCDDERCLAPEEVPFEFNFAENNTKEALSFNQQQILEPVKWDFNPVKIDDTTYDLIFTANIDEDWALYSQFIEEGGPNPTTFTFEANDDFALIKNVVESDKNKMTKHDPVFDMKVAKFYNQASFTQRIKLNTLKTIVKGELLFMSCDDRVCVFPPETEFQFNINSNGESTGFDLSKINTEDTNVNNDANKLLYGMSPEDIISSSVKVEQGKSLWSIFALGFFGGLLALLTPCVFPMIPLTVSFFTKSGSDKKGGISKAILYGFFILAVYLVLSAPFHLLDSVNPDILNEISTNVILNVIFFIVFVFFAFSFFGYYELTLPNSWMEKTTKDENIGGVLGVFFMALTLALVSFSCTGPILGSLLAGSLSTDGGAWQLTAGMGGFGVALGLPFALFAMFPNMLNSLPKSGGWLNTTKVVLGFLELALAFKFLSNADLVQHWGLLKIEVFLGLWIIIFAGLALYAFAKIKFPHDSPIKKLSFFRISSGILVTAFVVYLASGFRVNKETQTFKPLTLLSGLAPPVGYSILHPKEAPGNLTSFKNLQEGIAYAKSVNKPIMIDFTGYACVNCRKMEENVWPDETINGYIKDKYVLISLYADDKTKLPESEQLEVERANGSIRKLKTIGHKWSHFQTQFFQSNTLPYYVLLTPDGKQVLNQPVGYTPNKEDYANFLKEGLEANSIIK